MKIEISDLLLNEFFDSLKDEIVKSEMKRIINNDDDYWHESDVEYYNNLQIAAAYIYNHHAEFDDHYEIEEWPE